MFSLEVGILRCEMWHRDGAAYRARIGLLTPHLDPVPESEFQALAQEGVSIHAARVPLGMIGPGGEVIPRVDADIAQAFSEPPALDDAAALLSAVHPTVVVYAFTSSSYLLGVEADARLKGRLERRIGGIPVVIQTAAVIEALRALAVRSLALIHPPWFSPDLDALGAAYFRSCGFDVVYNAPAALRNDFGEIRPRQIFDWAMSHVPETAEAVVIGGSGFRAIGAIEALEGALKRPVLSANQAAFWCALRAADVEVDSSHYGRIFKHDLPAD